MGYWVEWGIVSAEDVGAPHRRERVFIIATTVGRPTLPRYPFAILEREFWMKYQELGFFADPVPTAQRKYAESWPPFGVAYQNKAYKLTKLEREGTCTTTQWPTPNTQDAKGAGGAKSREDGRQAQLHDEARKWPIPTVQDHRDTPRLAAEVSQWPTPLSAQNSNRTTKRTPAHENGTHGLHLGAEAHLIAENWLTPRAIYSSQRGECDMDRTLSGQTKESSWPTPCTRDWKDNGEPASLARHTPPLSSEVHLMGESSSPSPDPTIGIAGVLSPLFAAELMAVTELLPDLYLPSPCSSPEDCTPDE